MTRREEGEGGRGVKRQLPDLGNDGRGVNRKLPDAGGSGECEARSKYLREYFRRLRDRLRNVRVCCGDWRRVCTSTPTVQRGTTGVFLDPPYSAEADRDMGCYAVDSGTVAHDVREWAIEAGRDSRMRIVLAGYDGEHPMPDDWRVVAWKTKGGYGNSGKGGDTRGKANAHRERLWLSPACLSVEDAEPDAPPLFENGDSV